MTRDFFDPTPEQQNVVLIDAATLQKAQRMIAGCEACSDTAETPFDYVLDQLTGSDPSITDYVLHSHRGTHAREYWLVASGILSSSRHGE